MHLPIRPFGWLAGVVGALALSVGVTRAQDAPPPPPQEGVEVQPRGQVHEAFAEPGGQPQAAPVVAKEPPPPISELPPDQKPEGNNIQWIAGYWTWDDDSSNFVWISGFWRAVPPTRQWVPGYWAKTDSGFQRVPGYWAGVNQSEYQYLPEPPAPIDAAPTAAPDDNSTYVPGTWVYRDTQFLWRAGYWVRYYPNWVWVPATYVWTPSGYIFTEGYWDYPLAARGLLFAPVRFERPLWQNPSWVYRPSYVVSDGALLTALFVRPASHAYYFGDYFDPGYERRGFLPWVSYRSPKVGYDPLFSHYQFANRADRTWETNLVKVYDGRAAGDFPRPGRSLSQQNTLVQNITNNSVTNSSFNVSKVNNFRNVSSTTSNVTMVAPLAQVNRDVVKLKALPPNQVAEEQKSSRMWHETAQQRERAELQAREKAPALKVGEKPRVGQFTIPQPLLAPHAREGAGGRPEPKPEVRPTPRPETRPEPKPEPKPEVRPQPQPQPKPEVRPEPKPETKPQPKPEVRPEPKPVPKPEVRPEPKPEPKPEVRPQPQPQPKPEVRPEPKPEPKPVPKPEVRPEPKPEPKPVPKPEVRPEPKPEPKPEVRPQPQPQPQPKPEVRPEPKPEPKPQPKPEVRPQPQPQPAPKPGPAPMPEKKPPQ